MQTTNLQMKLPQASKQERGGMRDKHETISYRREKYEYFETPHHRHYDYCTPQNYDDPTTKAEAAVGVREKDS